MGSSGGGTSGAVSYPAYIETIHGNWLDGGGLDTLTSSVTDIMDAAIGSSPWTGLTAYDPTADITAYEAAITAFAAILAGITDTTNWAALFTQAATSIGAVTGLTIADMAVADMASPTDVAGITEAVIVADGVAFAARLNDEINTVTLPRFRRGMQDINAVVSSAFPLGQAFIEGMRDRDIAKHDSEIRLMAAAKNADIDLANEQLDVDVNKANMLKDLEVDKANLEKDIRVGEIVIREAAEYERMFLEGTSQMLQLMLQRLSLEESYVKMVIEGKRIKIVAEKEETDRNAELDKFDGLWDLEVFQYGANVMASVSGGTATPHRPSTAQSVLGGAMSGAAAGAMIPGLGPLAGGIIGAAAGFLG